MIEYISIYIPIGFFLLAFLPRKKPMDSAWKMLIFIAFWPIFLVIWWKTRGLVKSD